MFRLALLAIPVVIALSGCSPTDLPQDSSPLPVPIDKTAVDEAVVNEVLPPPEVADIFEQPWPSRFTRRELADTALAKTYDFLDQRQQGASDELLTLVFQDTVDPFHHEWVTDVATLTVDSFAAFIPDGTLLVIGTDQSFFKETVVAEGRPYNSSAIPTGSDVCVAYQGTSWISLDQVFTRDRYPSDKEWAACIAHELFHVVQDSQDKGPGSQTLPPGHAFYRPLWLIEGSAQYMGHAVMSYGGYHDYWGTHFTAGKGVVDLERPLLTVHESWDTGGFDSYYWGSLATEYIIASVGIESLLNMWTFAGQGASFEEAFEQALGITVQDFYDRFDTMTVELTNQ